LLILSVAQADIFFEPYDFGIAYIGSVEKGDEEEQRENGKDSRKGRLASGMHPIFKCWKQKLTEDRF
jgi:hypothetical protein